MYRIVRNSVSIASDGKLRARLCRGTLALFAALCFFILPTCANAACGSFGVPGVKASIKLPPATHADFDFPHPFEHPTIVGLWHVVYTADGSTFNDTFDTWHADGTEFETAYLAPAVGDVCAGVWAPTGPRSVKLHHIGWVFSPSTPTATATNYFTLDEEVTVAEDNKTYSGNFTFKLWNLDGTPTKVEITGTMEASRITVN
jgi:hypothetical protein